MKSQRCTFAAPSALALDSSSAMSISRRWKTPEAAIGSDTYFTVVWEKRSPECQGSALFWLKARSAPLLVRSASAQNEAPKARMLCADSMRSPSLRE